MGLTRLEAEKKVNRDPNLYYAEEVRAGSGKYRICTRSGGPPPTADELPLPEPPHWVQVAPSPSRGITHAGVVMKAMEEAEDRRVAETN